jgi:hypothetical protein
MKTIAFGVLLVATAVAIPPAAADDRSIDPSLFANARLKGLMETAEAKADRFACAFR